MHTIGVVGMGYVGLTMAVALARKGFTVHGVDASPAVLAALSEGRAHLFEPGVEEGLAAFRGERLLVGRELPAAGVDRVMICVSTPTSPATHAPELETVRAAARHVAERCAPDTLVIVRSTVPVGASRGVVLPELTARWGAQARLAFAPERTIQGQALRELEELPQVVGGVDAASRDAAAALFSRVTRRVVPVGSLEAAELVKLVNNCHTDLIYAYGNEVALMAERWGLDPLEVIRAANLDYPRPDLARPGYGGGGRVGRGGRGARHHQSSGVRQAGPARAARRDAPPRGALRLLAHPGRGGGAPGGCAVRGPRVWLGSSSWAARASSAATSPRAWPPRAMR